MCKRATAAIDKGEPGANHSGQKLVLHGLDRRRGSRVLNSMKMGIKKGGGRKEKEGGKKRAGGKLGRLFVAP